jgi:hypothetical protein
MLQLFYWMLTLGGKKLRGDMKQFYIILSTMCAFMAMDFIHSGEFSPSRINDDRERQTGGQ